MRTIAAMLAIALPLGAAAQPVAFQRSGDIAWVCGGVGSDERRALEGLRPEAGLELLLVTAPRGAYLAGVQVALVPARGGGTPVTFESDGPTCLVQAPPGDYRIEARHDGVTRTARAHVRASGKAPRVALAFPDPEWDGIRASDEEKRQAESP
ncbi:MAG TPA: hypothetical protein VFE23_17320 [Usitatibacter sp.]|nr:hypothetical protein [Usitatibacter sp.]